MVARRQGEKLCALFGVQGNSVKAYASGIHPKEASERVQVAHDHGFTSFKVKVGFGAEIDKAGLVSARDIIGDRHQLMIDANQAWRSPQEAAENINALSRFDLSWIEEPLRANVAGTVLQRAKICQRWMRLMLIGKRASFLSCNRILEKSVVSPGCFVFLEIVTLMNHQRSAFTARTGWVAWSGWQHPHIC